MGLVSTSEWVSECERVGESGWASWHRNCLTCSSIASRAELASLARALRSYYMYVHVFVACCMLVPILESILKLRVIFFLTTGIDFEACRDLFQERLYDFFGINFGSILTVWWVDFGPFWYRFWSFLVGLGANLSMYVRLCEKFQANLRCIVKKTS